MDTRHKSEHAKVNFHKHNTSHACQPRSFTHTFEGLFEVRQTHITYKGKASTGRLEKPITNELDANYNESA